MTNASDLPVSPRSVIRNPEFSALREMIAAMPNARLSEYDNYNVETAVLARSKASTYIVTDDQSQHSDQTISVAEGQKWAEIQDRYIQAQEMLVIDGYIGNDVGFRTPARLIIEKRNANIAAMQKALYFDATESEISNWKPELTVIYTPNLKAEGYPNDRLIAVNLEQGVTRVQNHVDRMRPARSDTEELAIQHMREPGERMPVGLVKRRESPADTLPAQTAPDLGVVEDVARIIQADEVVLAHRPVERRHECNEGQAHPQRRIASLQPEILRGSHLRLNGTTRGASFRLPSRGTDKNQSAACTTQGRR